VVAEGHDRDDVLASAEAQVLVRADARRKLHRVKRVATSELPAGKHDVEIVALKPGDRVVGAALAPDGVELVFVAAEPPR
jgi:hypothetical protein